jgi:hypothetical protein
MQSKSKTVANNAKTLVAIDKYLSSVTLTLGGTSYTATSLKAVFSAESSAMSAADAAKTQWLSSVATQDAAVETAEAVRKLLRSWLIANYGTKASALLDEFGDQAPKTAVKSAQVKFVAVEKNRATRTARGTTSKKLKKEIKGTISVPEVIASAVGSSAVVSSLPGSSAPALKPAGGATG